VVIFDTAEDLTDGAEPTDAQPDDADADLDVLGDTTPDLDAKIPDVVDIVVNPDVILDATADDAEDTTSTVLYLTALTSESDYDALVVSPGDLKFLAWTAEAERAVPLTEACAFQNMAIYPFHIHFLKSFEPFADLTPPGYVTLVMRRETRTFWGGGVRYDRARAHPTTGVPGVLLWSIAAEETALTSITVADLVAADAALAPCIPFYAERRAFLASTDAQRGFVARNTAALTAAGIVFIE